MYVQYFLSGVALLYLLQKPSKFWHAGTVSQHLGRHLTNIKLSPELLVAPLIVIHHVETQKAGNDSTTCTESCCSCKCWDIIRRGLGSEYVARYKTHDVRLKNYVSISVFGIVTYFGDIRDARIRDVKHLQEERQPRSALHVALRAECYCCTMC